MDSRVARLQARADSFLFQPFLENIYRFTFLLSDCFLDPEIAKSTHLPFQFIDQIFKCGRVPETGAKPRISNAQIRMLSRSFILPEGCEGAQCRRRRPSKKTGGIRVLEPNGGVVRIATHREVHSPQSTGKRGKRAFGNKKTQFLFHKFRVVSRAFGGAAPNSRAFRVNPKADHARQKQHS